MNEILLAALALSLVANVALLARPKDTTAKALNRLARTLESTTHKENRA